MLQVTRVNGEGGSWRQLSTGSSNKRQATKLVNRTFEGVDETAESDADVVYWQSSA